VTLKLRLAQPRDSRILFEWRNDPVTRANSKVTEPVKWEDHQKWFDSSLHNSNRVLMIAFLPAGKAVGTVRIDSRDDGAEEVSYTVAPEQRGQGIGKEMMRQIVAASRKDLIAEIKPDNESSIRIVQALGFKEMRRENGLIFYKRVRQSS
jgi:RimJ/RimL family protein N-acetyltransferase